MTADSQRALRIGIIGMGGFAGQHHQAVQELEAAGECKLVATCDPNPGAFMDQMSDWALAPRGVLVFDHYLDMLDACASQLDLVTIPTPVPLHAEMHRACVERGLAVYLEKPPTLDPLELDEMLAIECRAARQTNVGFNFIVERERQQLKRRLMAGEFGRPRAVCFSGLWPRERSYYQRAGWAGRLTLNGRLVLDSCLGNALAHYVHNVLFWAGLDDLFAWAGVTQARAELYRAHAIQGADTMFVQAQTAGGIELRLAATHACDGDHRHREWIECDGATITYTTYRDYQIARPGVPAETHPLPNATLRDNLAAHLAYLHGERDRPLTTLAGSRPFVQLSGLIYVAASTITTVAPQHLRITPSPDGQSEWVAIHGIEDACSAFFASGRFPSEQGLAWARPGGTATIDELPRLRGVVNNMAL